MIPLFDGHCDTIWRFGTEGNTDELRRSTGHLDLERVEGVYGPYAQFFTLDSNKTDVFSRWERFLEGKERFYSEVAKNSDRIMACRTAQDAQKAAEQGKIAAFMAVEGAEMLDCDMDKLEEAWRCGVRAVNVTWNRANALSGSNKEQPEQGLTERGKCFVRKMRELGILVDVSHLSDPGFWDIMECSPGPVIATHSNSRSVYHHARNLTDDQILAVIRTGGVIGLNLYAGFLGVSPDVDTVIAHLDHMWELGGEDTVALGGDWDGANPLAKGFEDVLGWKYLYEELLCRGYPESLLYKLFYANMMKIVQKVCTVG